MRQINKFKKVGIIIVLMLIFTRLQAQVYTNPVNAAADLVYHENITEAENLARKMAERTVVNTVSIAQTEMMGKTKKEKMESMMEIPDQADADLRQKYFNEKMNVVLKNIAYGKTLKSSGYATQAVNIWLDGVKDDIEKAKSDMEIATGLKNDILIEIHDRDILYYASLKKLEAADKRVRKIINVAYSMRMTRDDTKTTIHKAYDKQK